MTDTKVINVFSALAQQTRLNVFKLLIKNHNGICPCQIADALKMPRNTLSFHLAFLSKVGLCTHKKSGKIIIYKPNCKTIHAVTDFLTKDCTLTHQQAVIKTEV